MRAKVICMTVGMMLTLIIASVKIAAYEPEVCEQFIANQSVALSQIQALYRDFARNADSDVIYPDFYGGSYLLRDDGRLVVLIVESMYEEARAHGSLGSLLDEGVMYKLVEYSYAELRSLQREIGDKIWGSCQTGATYGLANHCFYAANVSGLGVDVESNRTAIHIAEYNDEMIAGFRQYVFDSPMITFSQMGFLYLLGGPPEGVPWPVAVALGFMFLLIILLIINTVRLRKRRWNV